MVLRNGDSSAVDGVENIEVSQFDISVVMMFTFSFSFLLCRIMALTGMGPW